MIIENQLETIMRCLAADTEQDREQARAELREMLDIKPAETNVSKESIINAALLELGVPCSLKGHRCLVTAIGAVVDKPNLIGAMTKELYPLVAEINNTMPSRVERAIRHAIEVAWDRGDLYTLHRFFGNTVSISKGKPTNSEFIAQVAYVVRSRLKGAA